MANIQDVAGAHNGACASSTTGPTNLDLIAQTAYDLACLHIHQESNNLPSNHHPHSYDWHNPRNTIRLDRSEQSWEIQRV